MNQSRVFAFLRDTWLRESLKLYATDKQSQSSVTNQACITTQ